MTAVSERAEGVSSHSRLLDVIDAKFNLDETSSLPVKRADGSILNADVITVSKSKATIVAVDTTENSWRLYMIAGQFDLSVPEKSAELTRRIYQLEALPYYRRPIADSDLTMQLNLMVQTAKHIYPKPTSV